MPRIFDDCKPCRGTGRTTSTTNPNLNDTCPSCKGSGIVERQYEEEVRLEHSHADVVVEADNHTEVRITGSGILQIEGLTTHARSIAVLTPEQQMKVATALCPKGYSPQRNAVVEYRSGMTAWMTIKEGGTYRRWWKYLDSKIPPPPPIELTKEELAFNAGYTARDEDKNFDAAWEQFSINSDEK